MRKWLVLAFSLIASVASAQTTVTTHISTGGTLPASCRNGDLWYKTGASAGLYDCPTAPTWRLRIPGVVGTSSFGIVIDGGGSTITTGTKGFVTVPKAGTISQVTLLSTDSVPTSGSIVIDLWKDTYANYPPDAADKICASACPTLATAIKFQSTSFGTWSTTTIAAGDVVGFSVASVSLLSRVMLLVTVVN